MSRKIIASIMKVVLLIAILVFITNISSKTTVISNENRGNFTSHYSDIVINDAYKTYIIIDEKTGVNYIVLTRWTNGGDVCITPRYDSNGNIYISK